MNELIAFILGLITKALLTIVVGKLVSWGVSRMRDWPRILHYLESHGGKSFDCITCNPKSGPRVDAVG